MNVPLMNGSEFLEEVSKVCAEPEGDEDKLENLLQVPARYIEISKCLSICSWKGDNHRLVRILLEDHKTNGIGCCRVDPTYYDSIALLHAAERGRRRIVFVLLDDGRCNPNAQNGLILLRAIENGHTDVAKYLLWDKRTDPSLDNNKSLLAAIKTDNVEIVGILLNNISVCRFIDWSQVLALAEERGNDEMISLVKSKVN